jgi:hypothetical protein
MIIPRAKLKQTSRDAGAEPRASTRTLKQADVREEVSANIRDTRRTITLCCEASVSGPLPWRRLCASHMAASRYARVREETQAVRASYVGALSVPMQQPDTQPPSAHVASNSAGAASFDTTACVSSP